MPVHAAFEEKEYEVPLAHQLSAGPHLWPPGQVLEHHFGFDFALWGLDFWNALGFPAPLPGVILNDISWGFVWRRIDKRALPNFALNLFIQAKRPERCLRRPRALASRGLASPYFRFRLTDHQQRTLERVQRRLGPKRALVAYAAAAFVDVRELYRHIDARTLAANSTFVPVAQLAGHERWHYDAPGRRGVANPDPEAIDGPDLLALLATLAEQSGEVEALGPSNALKTLEGAVLEATADGADVGDERAVRVHHLVGRIRGELREPSDARAPLSAFLSVMSFCVTYGLQWFVVGA